MLAAAAESLEKSVCEGIEEDEDDELLMSAAEDAEKSILEDEAAKVNVKEKADEEDYESLGINPPTEDEEKCLQREFGLNKFKPLQWKIISSVMKDRKGWLVDSMEQILYVF